MSRKIIIKNNKNISNYCNIKKKKEEAKEREEEQREKEKENENSAKALRQISRIKHRIRTTREQ